MGEKNPILLVLAVPPPYGGGEVQAEIVAEYFGTVPGFRVFSYARGSGSKSTQGRVTVGNLSFGLYYIVRCVSLMLAVRPRAMYLSLPKNFVAFARVIPVILSASLMRIRVYGELAGARFLFLDRGWQRTVGLFVLRRLHSIRFLGDHIREGHVQFGFRNPVVISNGIRIPHDRTRAPLPATGRIGLLYVGALNHSKGVGRVIEAVKLCRDHGLDVVCTLLGEWSDPLLRKDVERFITQQRLQDRVRFTGLIKGEQKWAYYRESAILVHPTEWDGQPLTILEALGMGLAVISTPVGAIPDTVVHGKNGILLAENTPEKLFEAVQELYADRSRLAEMMAHNQSDFERRFTVEIFLENLEKWLTSA
jgi:glycosyltransferase involved in cell wall biosynthesis